MPATIVVSRHIQAPPDTLWTLVTDLPRMGEWSPENTGGVWMGGAAAAAKGVKFKGSNANGKRKWNTMCTVTEHDAPRVFAFDVSALGLALANWRYEIVAADSGGSTVTETWTDQRGPIAKLFGGPASGVKDREAHNRAGMEHTLAELAVAAEA
jgi:uncharacterized protein YndB with AHSA1/START domain